MSITGYQGDNYKDLVSGTTGAAASSIAPNLSTATANTQETLAWNTYHSQRALMDWARQQDRSKRQFDLGVRSLPAAYNRRGMLDSGQYQRGGQRLADAYGRATGDLRSDLETVLQGLGLQDLTAQYDLGELRQMVGTDRFQQVVANALRSQGMA